MMNMNDSIHLLENRRMKIRTAGDVRGQSGNWLSYLDEKNSEYEI
jgi:hypothetical protein